MAFAGYTRPPGAERAEVAFVVADALQGRGVGTRLLERLAEMARAEGIRYFDANAAGENRKMIRVFYDSGFEVSGRTESGLYRGELALEVTPAFAQRSAERAQMAATASMRAFFEPRVVAVVGANRERGGIGAEILHNLMAAGFRGTVIPIHPQATEIQGLRAYPRVERRAGGGRLRGDRRARRAGSRRGGRLSGQGRARPVRDQRRIQRGGPRGARARAASCSRR